MSGSKRGDVNGYTCDQCGHHTYIVHVDDGVTPMFLACRYEGKDPGEAECKGQGTSLMYPSPPIPEHVKRAVGWEWFKPLDLDGYGEGMRDHIERGGLDLRPLTDEGRQVLGDG
jgi:hypothetical protein